MHEYIISNIVNDTTITLYHIDNFSRIDMLKMFQEIIGYIDTEKGDELFYSTIYMMCDKFGFVNKEWIEYEFNLSLDFEDARELRRYIKEEIYEF